MVVDGYTFYVCGGLDFSQLGQAAAKRLQKRGI
jgi:hypothetical protein